MNIKPPSKCLPTKEKNIISEEKQNKTNSNGWLSMDEVQNLTGETRETIRRKCKKGLYDSIAEMNGHYKDYYINPKSIMNKAKNGTLKKRKKQKKDWLTLKEVQKITGEDIVTIRRKCRKKLYDYISKREGAFTNYYINPNSFVNKKDIESKTFGEIKLFIENLKKEYQIYQYYKAMNKTKYLTLDEFYNILITNAENVWFDVKILAFLKGCSSRNIRHLLNENKYTYKKVKYMKQFKYQINLASLDKKLQKKYIQFYYDVINDYSTLIKEYQNKKEETYEKTFS